VSIIAFVDGNYHGRDLIVSAELALDSSGKFRAQLTGFSLTTAEILYRMPDHPSLLQTYVRQEYDVHPRFPRLKHFLDFWTRNLDGKLYRVH
jgi:uncharacterized protein Usg